MYQFIYLSIDGEEKRETLTSSSVSSSSVLSSSGPTREGFHYFDEVGQVARDDLSPSSSSNTVLIITIIFREYIMCLSV